jgi:hypothetical protein
MRLRGRAVSRTILFGVAILCTASISAFGQSAASGGLSLIQQDFSDCTNTTVKDNPERNTGGEIWVTRNSDGTTFVKVGMTVTPNTTYHFYLKCVRQLGDIKTDDDGIGIASFEFQTSSVGNVFAFDMYPEGAPSGNKFQSLTVLFK